VLRPAGNVVCFSVSSHCQYLWGGANRQNVVRVVVGRQKATVVVANRNLKVAIGAAKPSEYYDSKVHDIGKAPAAGWFHDDAQGTVRVKESNTCPRLAEGCWWKSYEQKSQHIQWNAHDDVFIRANE
jgi:hypothetical protein